MVKFTKLFCTAFLLLAGFVSASAQDETIDLSADMFYQWDGYGADASSTGAVTVDFNVGVELGSGAMVAGTSSVAYLIYADLTGCTKMLFEGTAGVQLRVLMNRQESNSGPLVEKNPTIGDDGTAELDLTEFAYVHLNAIKTGWSSPTGTITAIKLVKPSDPLALNKEQLKKALSHAKMQSPFAKTEASWNALQNAITAGEAALTSATDATALDAAKSAVEAAEAALELLEGYTELTKEMFLKYASLDAPGEGEATGCAYETFVASGLPYGDGNVGELNWADLTSYEKLVVTTVGDVKPRFCLNRLVKDGQQAETKEESNMLDINPNNAFTWSTEKYLTTEDGIYTLDLTEIVADYTFARLHCIKKQGWGAGVVVTGMYLYKAPVAEPVIPDGTYYVMSANEGTLVNAEGALDTKGAPITFTFSNNAYTIEGADFFTGKQWTIANAIEGMSGFYTISTADGFLAVSATNALEQIADGTADAAVWILLQKAYWEDIVNSTYTVAGTKNLTGTENDWEIAEANQMALNEETGLFEKKFKRIAIDSENQPEFKVVQTNMEGATTWYPEGDESTNWVITTNYVGGEGLYDITITFDPSDFKEIGVIAEKRIVFPADAIVYDFEAAAAAGENPANKNGSAANGQAFYGWENPEKTDSKRQDYKGYEWAEGSVLPEECHIWRRSDRINGNVAGNGGLKCPSNKEMAIDGLNPGDKVIIVYDAENATDKEIIWAIGDGSSDETLEGPRATATIAGVEAVPGETTIASGAEIVVNSVTPADNGTGYIVFQVKKGMVIQQIAVIPGSEVPTPTIPDGTYYVMNATYGLLVSADGVDKVGTPITFTWDATAGKYNITGAQFFEGNQWTVEGDGFYTISTVIDNMDKYAYVDVSGYLTIIQDNTVAEGLDWTLLQTEFWENEVLSFNVAGTADLCGTEWDVNANKMTRNEAGLFEWKAENITVSNSIKPEFKVVANNTYDEETVAWYPGGDNWIINTDITGGAGIFTITITFDVATKRIDVAAEKTGDIEETVTPLYVIGDANGWNRASMIELPFDQTTSTYKYEIDATGDFYFAFANYQPTEEELANDASWDVFNSTYRFAIAAGDQTAELDKEYQLVKVNGTIKLVAGKYNVYVTNDFKMTIKDATTDGINAVATTADNAAIFNMAGQRVMNARKGLFIINGKKVVK